MHNISTIVLSFCHRIKNNRTIRTAFNHMVGEVNELDEEIDADVEGEDGVVGEAIDVIACAIDIIYLHKPDITAEEIDALMIKKCEKWERKYGNKDYSQ